MKEAAKPLMQTQPTVFCKIVFLKKQQILQIPLTSSQEYMNTETATRGVL